MLIPLIFLSTMILSGFYSIAQDSLGKFQSRYVEQISRKVRNAEEKLDRRSVKVVNHVKEQEQKLKQKLMKVDSLKANEIFGDITERYKQFAQELTTGLPVRQYIPSLDTIGASLEFLQQHPESFPGLTNANQKIVKALDNLDELKDQFDKAENIKKLLKERMDFLKERLGEMGFVKQLKQLNKQVYYYAEQLNEYKSMLADQRKIERKAIDLLAKSKLFNDFIKRNGMLASLFSVPGDPVNPLAQSNLAGLQTRAQLNNIIQQQIAAGGAGARQQFSQNIQDAQNKINDLQRRILARGTGKGSSSDDIMPEGFRPNDLKTKSFLQRLEYGTNFQTQRASNLFPVTTDLALSVGYKLNDKSVLGIGASYKLGWGRGWNHIRLSHEGLGLRSYLDWKLKGNLYLSGGYEQNHRTAFDNIDQLRQLSNWQQSGLLGLSKIISIRTRLFHKTRLQLLWDFLSYRQSPPTQPLVFRVGYNF